MPRIDIGGLPFHVEDTGSGPPLVLVHAFLGTADVWAGQRLALSARYRVITYDARGHGRSAAPRDPGAYGLSSFVDDLVGILDALALPRAYLCGLSMGAEVVLHTLLRHPERVLAAALADYGSGSVDPGRFRASMEETARAFLTHGSAWTFQHRLLESELVIGLGARRKRALDGMRRTVESQDPEAMAHTIRGILTNHPSPGDLAPELRRVDRPVLIIRGALDRAVAGPSSVLAGAIPGAEEVVIAGAGHVTNIQAPGEFSRALGGFLDRCQASERETPT